jgi:hypothetical protein
VRAEPTPEPAGPKYVDHPAPSVGFMILISFVVLMICLALPQAVGEISSKPSSYLPLVIAGISLAVLGFYFWPLYTTYYTLSPSGLLVRYGPWIHHYSYSEFTTAYWQRGMFGTRIGWPSVTPCVRLTNAVLLKGKARWFGLYLTPNDPKAFLLKLAEFAPDLTREAII